MGHGALGDVVASDIPGRFDAAFDILFGLVVGFNAAVYALGGEKVGKQLIGADDMKSLVLLQGLENGGQKPVIAEDVRPRFGEKKRRPGVGPERRKGRPADRSGQNQFLAPGGL